MSTLEHKLTRRPSKADLEARNIVVSKQNAHSPKLHGAIASLKKAQRRDSLSSKIRRRASQSDMIELGVLKAEHKDVHPKIVQAGVKLEKAMTSDTINKHLRSRPSIHEIKTSTNELHKHYPEAAAAHKEEQCSPFELYNH